MIRRRRHTDISQIHRQLVGFNCRLNRAEDVGQQQKHISTFQNDVGQTRIDEFTVLWFFGQLSAHTTLPAPASSPTPTLAHIPATASPSSYHNHTRHFYTPICGILTAIFSVGSPLLAVRVFGTGCVLVPTVPELMISLFRLLVEFSGPYFCLIFLSCVTNLLPEYTNTLR
jgi:hypothetical protein